MKKKHWKTTMRLRRLIQERKWNSSNQNTFYNWKNIYKIHTQTNTYLIHISHSSKLFHNMLNWWDLQLILNAIALIYRNVIIHRWLIRYCRKYHVPSIYHFDYCHHRHYHNWHYFDVVAYDLVLILLQINHLLPMHFDCCYAMNVILNQLNHCCPKRNVYVLCLVWQWMSMQMHHVCTCFFFFNFFICSFCFDFISEIEIQEIGQKREERREEKPMENFKQKR